MHTHKAKFVIREEAKLYKTLLDIEEEAQIASQEKLSTSNWTGPTPWLRLYSCMFDDRAVISLKNSQQLKNREELDARNNEERPETFEEVVATLYNDPENVYYTELLPELHFVYADVMELDFTDMPGGKISAEDVKKKIAECRVKLIQVCEKCVEKTTLQCLTSCPVLCCTHYQIISNWEASGNGFGQRTAEDSDFGHYQDQTDGDNRASFIQVHLGHRVHHLYLWHLADKMGVLQHVLNVLSCEVAGDSDNPPKGTSKVQRKRKSTIEDEEEREDRRQFRRHISASMSVIAVASHMEALSREEDKVTKYRLEMYRATNIDEKKFFESLVDHHKDRVIEIEQIIRDMRGTTAAEQDAAEDNANSEQTVFGSQKSVNGRKQLGSRSYNNVVVNSVAPKTVLLLDSYLSNTTFRTLVDEKVSVR